MRDLWSLLRERREAAVRASPIGIEPGRLILVCSLAGLFMGWVGPFGSAAAPPVLRYGYWISAINLGGLLAWAVILLIRLIPGLKARPWATAMTCAVVMTPPGTVLIWAWTKLLFGPFAPPGTPFDYAPQVFGVSVAMSAINLLASLRAAVPAPAPAPAAEPAPSRFLQRLPDRLKGADLYAIQAEDHYLRVHTSRGSDLILCRLADAVTELEGIDGLQTHRSWWVARLAVTAVTKADGRAVLTLTSGAEAPVSRNALPKLREQGWV